MIRKLVLLIVAPMVMLATPAFAQEAPDATVKRVAEDVLATIRSDKDIQAGNQAKIKPLMEKYGPVEVYDAEGKRVGN